MRLLEPFIWILWDILAILVFFHFVSRCARRGFVSTLAGLVIYAAAIAAAYATYKSFAIFVYDNVIHDVVLHKLTRNFNEILTSTGEDAANIVYGIPFMLRMMLGSKRGEIESMPFTAADDMALEVLESALRTPLMTVLHTVGFLFMFTVAAYIMRKLTGLLTAINNMPIIGTLNMILGGVAGVIEGLITLIVTGFILRMLVAFSGEIWWWLNTEVMESTYIWNVFY